MNGSSMCFKVALMVTFLLQFFACTRIVEPSNVIEEIDLIKAFNNRYEVPISSIASEIEYIRLESGANCMLNDPHLINVKDSLILFIGFKKLYVFSRRTGKFLYEISGFGRGPDEYSATTSIYEEKKDLFFVSYAANKRDNNNFPIFAAHGFDGQIRKLVSKPVLFNSENDELPISRFWPLDDSLYLGYVDNPMANIPQKLVVFTQKGEFIRSFRNFNVIDIEHTNKFSMSLNLGMFFYVKDTVRFFELHTDTIFNVSKNRIQPRYHIEMGDLILPYEMRYSNPSEFMSYFHIINMQESTRFIMFSASIYGVRHIACYDKLLKKTMVCNTPDDISFYKADNCYGIRCMGFMNDLDNFVSIVTDKNFYINKNNELVTMISAMEVQRWFNNNPERVKQLPKHLIRFSTIKTEDNPIIVVLKLKE